MITLSKKEKIETVSMTVENFPSWELWAWKPGGGCSDKSCFLPRALGSPTFSCSFGERKHHVTLLPPKLGILETVLELIGGTGSFVHPMSQQRHSFNTWENEEWKSFPLCVSQKELREDGKSPWQHRGDFLNGGVSYTRTRKSCYWQREVWGGFHNLL